MSDTFGWSPEERRSLVTTILNALAPLSEREADDLLAAAGASGPTPSGWGQATALSKRLLMMPVLDAEPDQVLANIGVLIDELLVPDRTSVGASADDKSDDGPTANPRRPADGSESVDAAAPIFIVHGHAHAIRHEIARVLERATGRQVVVLHEQPNAGRTILEKFEDNAARASYAVVLLTADDEGGTASSTERRARGRQNMIFELGFFFGMLGRKRVAVLLEPGVEKPSDIDGLVYIPIDPGGAWKHSLARELASVGFSVDYSRIP